MSESVCVIGLGYVGLPLAVTFAGRFRTVGFDVDGDRVAQCRRGIDVTGEVSTAALEAAPDLYLTDDISECLADYFVVAVPTPVDAAKRPDFGPLVGACGCVARVMQAGATVVFESTVYPGATEDICVPELEKRSGLVWGKDFNVAYSPERVNPGDKEHTLTKIVKLVAGDNERTLERVAALYAAVLEAGVYKVDSIAVAEAAKVIENTQRDLNIALVNELSIIFNRMGLDTAKVLRAAGTKWNFMPFRPGLVGGHCIGVDPYYLTYKAQMLGYHPEIILAGRRINDGMGKHVAENTLKTMLRAGIEVKGATVNVLGITFKENCPDLRNSQVINVINELKTYGLEIVIHDPVADASEAVEEFGVELSSWESLPVADVLLVAVAHQQFLDASGVLLQKLSRPGAVIDVKSILDVGLLSDDGVAVWRL